MSNNFDGSPTIFVRVVGGDVGTDTYHYALGVGGSEGYGGCGDVSLRSVGHFAAGGDVVHGKNLPHSPQSSQEVFSFSLPPSSFFQYLFGL